MNKECFLEDFKKNKIDIDKMVEDYFSNRIQFDESMFYAAGGGKRVRASLYLFTKKMFSETLDVLDYKLAMAIELIHAYSLVHDDLPAMDNDDYRRGQLSCHKKFGEDIAILTGDALLNEAMIIILELAGHNTECLKAGAYIMNKASRYGMIGGQLLDLRRNKSYDLEYVLKVYDKKTADLFKASVVSAGIMAKLDREKLEKLESFAYNLGIAFQIQDDLLEEVYDDELNILNVISKEEAEKFLEERNEEALRAIDEFDRNENLKNLVSFLSKRDY